jgi:flagellar biosynthesis chaperone FliJ
MASTSGTSSGSQVIKYNNFNDFLRNHITKEKHNITHTRIGDINKSIYPAKYYIPDNELSLFYKLY